MSLITPELIALKITCRNLKRSQSLTYLGMLFYEEYEDTHIEHAIRARYGAMRTPAGAIFSRLGNTRSWNAILALTL